MDDALIDKILRANGVNALPSRGKMKAPCPFAPWRHGGGSDSSPSFAVFPGGGYNCLSCGAHGHVSGLHWHLAEVSGRFSEAAHAAVWGPWGENVVSYGFNPKPLDYGGGGAYGEAVRVLPEGRSRVRRRSGAGSLRERMSTGGKLKPLEFGVETLKPLPRWAQRRLDAAQRRPVPEYALSRGVTEESYRRWGMGDDVKDRRIVVPIYSDEGDLVATTARYYGPDEDECVFCGFTRWKVRPSEGVKGAKHYECPSCNYRYAKWLHSTGFKRNLVVGGLHLLEPGHPAIGVEGPLDSIRLDSAGARCPISFFGSNIAPSQLQLVANKTKRLYMMGDADTAGVRMNKHAAELVDAMGLDLEVIPVTYYDAKKDGLKYVVENELAEDPGEMTAEMIRDVLPPDCFG